MEKMLISGVAKDTEVARISVKGVPNTPGIAFKMFSRLAKKGINVDIILQSIGQHDKKDISFTVAKSHGQAAVDALEDYVISHGASEILLDEDVAKISIVGAGMVNNPGVAAMMFEALAAANVNIDMISTSEIKVSVLIPKEDSERAMRAVHDKFF